MEEQKNRGIPIGILIVFMAALVTGYMVATPSLLYGGAGGSSFTATPPAQGAQQAVKLQAQENVSSPSSKEVQEILMNVDASGWTPDNFVLKKGVPVRWIIDVKELTGCNKEIIVRDYGLDIKLKEGQNLVEFTPSQSGTVRWSCWMGMIDGVFYVVDNPADQAQIDALKNGAPTVKKSGGCGCGVCGRKIA